MFVAQWNNAKRTFESSTVSKKPSAKFLGVFHRSGVESAAKALDDSMTKTIAKMEEALRKFKAATTDYKKVLTSAAKEEKGAIYLEGLKMLARTMDKIEVDFGEAIKTRITQEAEALEKKQADTAEALCAAFGKGFVPVRASLKKLESDVSALNNMVGEAAAAAMAKDAAGANTKVGQIKNGAKLLVAEAARIKTAADKLAGTYRTATRELAALPSKHPATKRLDQNESVVMDLESWGDKLRSLSAKAVQAVQDGDKVLKGTLDTGKLFDKQLERLSDLLTERAGDATSAEATLTSLVNRIRGNIDKVASAKPEDKAALLAEARSALGNALPQAKDLEKLLESSERERDVALRSLPETVNAENPAFSKHFKFIEQKTTALREVRTTLTKRQKQLAEFPKQLSDLEAAV